MNFVLVILNISSATSLSYEVPFSLNDLSISKASMLAAIKNFDVWQLHHLLPIRFTWSGGYDTESCPQKLHVKGQ